MNLWLQILFIVEINVLLGIFGLLIYIIDKKCSKYFLCQKMSKATPLEHLQCICSVLKLLYKVTPTHGVTLYKNWSFKKCWRYFLNFFLIQSHSTPLGNLWSCQISTGNIRWKERYWHKCKKLYKVTPFYGNDSIAVLG